ncbi:helix-turn-helix domain-containing protein [Streptomyces sp. 8N616]|uniref:helix-turn-helix domain-containing protein n=1 Tax=Streptomyces sp. 8N616 TaxID=3457414 RepID=UPI003FD5745F
MGTSESYESASVTVHVFGNQLKLFRELAGLTREETGQQLGYAPDTIKAYELARRIPDEKTVEKADEVLGARGVLKAAIPALEEARFPTFLRDLARFEAKAVSLYTYDPLAVPGLLQTEDYARAVIGARVPTLPEEEVERRVGTRLDRQAVLTREEPPVVNFVIEQSALERPIGGQSVHRAQLEQLLERGRLRNVSVQIMPTTVEEHPGLDGFLILLETPERRMLGYVEGQANSQLVSDRKKVSGLKQRYDMIRTQALSTRESTQFIKELAG